MPITHLFRLLLIVLTLTVQSAFATRRFLTDGGAFITLERDGCKTTYQLSHSSSGEPSFHGAELGAFNSEGGSSLRLTGFAAHTYEDGGSYIGGAAVVCAVYPEDASERPFVTNYHTAYYSDGLGEKCHYATNLNVNLAEMGLTPGNYLVETYLFAYGNAEPLLNNRDGSNFIARFTYAANPLPPPPTAAPNGKTVLSFSCQTNTGFGNDLYVVGNHPDLGSWNPVDAKKLYWTENNIWRGTIAVTAPADIDYKFIIRTNEGSVICDGANNVVWFPGPNRQTNAPGITGAPYSGKTIYYYSDWTNAAILYQCGFDTNFYNLPLQRIDTGRTPGEYLYSASGFAKAGEKTTFVPHGFFDGVEHWDNCPIEGIDNYFTTLDVFFLQDGQVYNYTPPETPTAGRIETTWITSDLHPTIPSRNVRIFLPRNYDLNTEKSYPVLYLHDGQNVFSPGGIYGCWHAEIAAEHLISLGMMSESILVAVDNSDERLHEYLADGDSTEYGDGTANLYLHFLAHNVKPHIDTTYRTLPDKAHTATLGSSFGGIVSIYLGLSSNVFGRVGPMSPSFWACTNFVQQKIREGDSSGLRIYMDCGTRETSEAMWEPMWEVYNYLSADGYAENSTLLTTFGCGQEHNEAAWSIRITNALTFLMDIRDDPNELARLNHPPQSRIELTGDEVSLRFQALKEVPYILQRTDHLVSPVWQNIHTAQVTSALWANTSLEDTNPPTTRACYRILSRP
ncbi:MAG: alpha/beta hydrolase-fold protein [Kiritimatiellae bacterium]|nr:alpha/beta hydrolase-fold protein [Kiritimatiellia bacterium]